MQYPGYWAFTDGSYRHGVTTWGVAMVRDDREIAVLNGRLEDAGDVFGRDLDAVLASGSHQIGGEVAAVYRAVQWCVRHGVVDVTIAHDLKGLPLWAQGKWKANVPATKALRRDAPHWPVRIKWVKVKAHRGNRFNEKADSLAKDALGEPPANRGQDAVRDIQAVKAEAFREILRRHGLGIEPVTVHGIYARVRLADLPGMVDIYNTKKRNWRNPYLHGFRDRALQRDVERLWQEFAAAES